MALRSLCQLHCLQAGRPFKNFLGRSEVPVLLFGARRIPTFLLATNIVVFSTVSTVRRCKARVMLPILSKGGHFANSIFVVRRRPGAGHKDTRASLRFAVTTTLRVMGSVSRRSSSNIATFLRLQNSVVDVVVSAFIVITPGENGFTISRFFSVRQGFVGTRTACVHHNIFRFLYRVRLATRVGAFLYRDVRDVPNNLYLELFRFATVVFPAFKCTNVLANGNPGPFATNRDHFKDRSARVEKNAPYQEHVDLVPSASAPDVVPILLRSHVHAKGRLTLDKFCFTTIPSCFSYPCVPGLCLVDNLPHTVFQQARLPSRAENVENNRSSITRLAHRTNGDCIFHLRNRERGWRDNCWRFSMVRFSFGDLFVVLERPLCSGL